MRPGLIALLLALWLALPALASAERSIRVETVKSTTPNGKPAVALVVNGQMVAQLAKQQRERSPTRNISVAAALITAAYRAGKAELSVQATDDSGRRYAVFLNGKVLLVATDLEGKAWGAAPQELAHTWLKNLEEAWDLQSGGAPEDEPASPADEDRPDKDGQTAAETPTDSSRPSTPLTGGTLDTTAGDSRLHPDYDGLTISAGHQVYDPPGYTSLPRPAVPEPLTAQVTGSGSTQASAALSVDNAIRCHVGVPAGTKLSWQVEKPSNGALHVTPGQRKKLSVGYTTAAGALPATGKLQILLENRAVATPKESLTFFSNTPERVSAPQLLYHADLPARNAGRLVFHHQNQSRGELELVARVVNIGQQPAALHVIPGTAEPDINTFYVGFKSAEVFWYNLNAGNGYVLSLPPGREAYLVDQRLPRGFTSSGYFKLTNLGDSTLRVETLALQPGSNPPQSPASDTAGASHSVYPAPYFVLTDNFQVGDPWLYLRLGENSPASLSGDNALDGSYGMTHSFNVELNNPGGVPALVFVVLRASAGEVKGQFFIDDEYVATPLIVGGDEQLLKEIPLKPGETKLLRIKALPLNGGYYPASIILRESRYP